MIGLIVLWGMRVFVVDDGRAVGLGQMFESEIRRTTGSEGVLSA